MDTRSRYRQIIERILLEYAEYMTTDETAIRRLPIFDSERNQYLLMTEGWEGQGSSKRRLHYISFHLEFANGKIYVQADNTDAVIVEDLERAGVPRSDIVLAFHEPEMRQYTGYAVE